MSRDVATYLSNQQRNSTNDTAADWTELEKLYSKKLWHELTLKLSEFVKHPMFATGQGLIEMYESFISDFEHRINPLALVELIVYIIRQIQDAKQSLDFLEKIKEKVKHNKESHILCLTTIAHIHLQQKAFDTAKVLIKEADELIKDIDGVTSVHSRFYDLSSNYYKLMNNHAEYYRDALRFLGCMELDDIPVEQRIERAYHLGLAAILGEGVYNFGELLAHPILDALKKTDKEWLVNLLYAFNSGNISTFDELRPQWSIQPDLKAHENRMRQKITMLCLMEMTFKRPANNRQLAFKEIASEARIPADQVELLVMKCLSLGLVKGSIDEPEQRVHMTWVQPRVLDITQISVIQERLATWCKDINDMESLLSDHAHDIVTA